MKNVLGRYRTLSGQLINFGKSSIVFNANTRRDLRKQVCDALQVCEIAKPCNYLGLPMHIGRRKNDAFKFLSDHVNHKLQSWGNKALSRGEKLVLLKTAAQTIPNCWMQLLLIPGEVCTGIQRQMNSFWWDNRGANKGIHWMTWDKLCIHKRGGRLGFRELSKFNIVMLAK